MSPPAKTAKAKARQHADSSNGKQQRKQRVLTQKRASQGRSISDAVVIKDEDVFFFAIATARCP